ncbi:hypothetical protein BJX76DRAFT_368477 [Aspergillus varians]
MQPELRYEFARELRIPIAELDGALSFTGLGGHSLSALRLVSTCKRLGFALTVGDLLQNTAINDIISRFATIHNVVDVHVASNDTDLRETHIDLSIRITPSPSDSPPSARCLTPDTVLTIDSLDTPTAPIPEMQLSLIQGTYAKPGNNILSYHCMCPVADLSDTRAAWQQVLEGEEIFRTEFRVEDGEGHLIDSGHTPCRWSEIHISDRHALNAELQKCPNFSDIGFEFKVITMAGDTPAACILWHVHHAFIDGFSMRIILDKVSRVLAGEPTHPGPSFATVAWERALLGEERKAEAMQYWDSQKEILETASSEIRIPRTADVCKSGDFWNNVATFMVNVSQSQLAEYAHSQGVTVASIYYAAWALVLSVVCDSNLVQLGVVMSGRSLPVLGILEAVGSLVNTLPIGIAVDKDMNATSFISKVFRQLIELSSFDWSTPDHGYRRQFSSVLAMQFDVADRTNIHEPGTSRKPSSRMNSEIPLSITVETEGIIHIQSSPEYDANQINLLGTYVCRTIESLMRPSHTTAAAQNPDYCAAEQGVQSISYRALDKRSDCVAAHLSMYVKQDDVVCVHACPSINWLVAIYGILKVGAVYCPLNSKLDPELRNSMFQSSGAAVYLTALCSETRYRPKASKYVWAVEDLLQRQGEQEDGEAEFPHAPCPAGNAYLCFTSGSTGKPKGVLCTHRGLVAFQSDLEVRLHAQPGRRIAQIMSVSFDGSIHEVFSALSYGATLVLPNADDPFSHLHEVDTCIFTPSLAATLDPRDYPHLRNVYLVGEQVPQDTNDRWGARLALYNMYGPTETTWHKVTIGRPNPTTRIYILDRNGHLAAPGVMGQIYLAGVQVSNGYIGQPDLTKERFFPDAVCRGLGERMYGTGDIGYWNQDGELVCLGRNDRQTKLRGFRLDLDDVEALARYEDDLVALIQPATACAAQCRKQMTTVLPTHAVPRYIIPVAKFPMTPTVDIRAVARPSNVMSTTERRETEITPNTNFIAIGGHSLLQLRLASRLSKVFNCSVPLTTIIEAATLRDLSCTIDKLRQRECREYVHASNEGHEHDVSRMEAEWISKYNCSDSTTSFNVSFACRLDSAADLHQLGESWNAVIASHKILRSRYTACGEHFKRIYSDCPPVVQFVDDCDVSHEINRPFDISNEDLIRIVISPTALLVTVSHIICDLTTMQGLLNDVERVYHGGTPRDSSPLYIAADAWQRLAPDEDLAFWTTYLANSPVPSTKRAGYEGTSQLSIVPHETALAMDDFIKASPFSHHQLALAAVALALNAQNESIDTLIGGPFLNRWSENDMNTIGLFLEPLPFRVHFDPKTVADADTHAFLRAVQCSSQAAISHAVPWQDLLCHLDIMPEFPNHPLFETMVTFHSRSEGLKLGVEGVEPLYTWSEGAKFGLMCEFTELHGGGISLRLEYDDVLYTGEEIRRVEKRITAALALLVRNSPYAEMICQLRGVEAISARYSPQQK